MKTTLLFLIIAFSSSLRLQNKLKGSTQKSVSATENTV